MVIFVGIDRDFEELVLEHESELSLGDFVGFSKQLASAGYVLKVGNKVNCLDIGFEKPRVVDLLKRFVALVTDKKLLLTQDQRFVFSEKKEVKLIQHREIEPHTLVYSPYGKIKEYYN